jgi:uncharacterized repeat protein (TIGR03803 family)
LAKKGSGWTLNPLYTFNGNNDGALPQLGFLTIAADGSLYGTTLAGGGGPCNIHSIDGCGTVFNLRPAPTVCKTALCPWTETILYRFTGGSDGAYPNGGPIFDQEGSLYGTAGSSPFPGNVYKLAHSGGSWMHSVVYAFSGSDGYNPIGELIFDKSGNLYGTTVYGGAYSSGTLFQLTPSGSSWIENVLYNFQDGSDGSGPIGGLIFDTLGNLYGAAANGGEGGGGTVFALAHSGGGSWTFNVLYGLTGSGGPFNNLVMDSAGNLYGTTRGDGNGAGSVFKLTPGGGRWTYSSLHDFIGGEGIPYSNLVLDASGNLYGTTYYGGDFGCGVNGCGVVFEITP